MAASRRVVWTPRARGHLLRIFDFVARDSSVAAEHLTRSIVERAERLDRFAERGRPLRDPDIAGLREVFVHRYRIVYEVTDDEVHVIAVVHGSRDFWSWWIDAYTE